MRSLIEFDWLLYYLQGVGDVNFQYFALRLTISESFEPEIGVVVQQLVYFCSLLGRGLVNEVFDGGVADVL